MRGWPDTAPPGWWRATRGVWALFLDQNLTLVAAGVAFFALLALFPILATAIAVWSMVADPATAVQGFRALEGVMPSGSVELLRRQATDIRLLASDRTGIAAILPVVFAIAAARAGAGAMIKGLDMVYRERPRRGIWRFLTSLGMTLGFIAGLCVALVLVVGVPVVMNLLPLGTWSQWALSFARWCVLSAALLIALGLVYRLAPNRRRARTDWLSPGALLAAALWLGLSALFSLYLDRFGAYNEVYGSIGAFAALMIWLYVGMLAVLVGGALNAELELRERSDTTVGPDRPMGERGAYVADTYIHPDKDRT